jgi:arylsulfatase A-like enzyme
MVSEELPSFVSEPMTLAAAPSRKAGVQALSIDRPLVLLLIAVWFGLVAGLGEVSLAAIAKFFLHHYTHLSPQIVWMTPSADAIVLAIPGLIFAIVMWRWPGTPAFRIATFVFAFLACLSVLLRVSWLQAYAAMILAVGLAVQTSHLVASHCWGFLRFVKRSLGVIVAIVLLMAISLYSWQSLAERRALAKLPPASPGAPNVLLIVLDTVGAEHLSLYGYSRPTTPQLERLAKTGVRFEHAISTAPWTLPSHASMFTGRYPHELSVQWHAPLDSAQPTLAEVLTARGYSTAGFVGNTVYCSSESGLNRGFAHYEDFTVSAKQIIPNSSVVEKIADHDTVRRIGFSEESFGRKTAERINSDVLNWLAHKDPQRPFFAFLNYFDAHAPYAPAKPFDSQFGSRQPSSNPRVKPSEKWSEAEVQAELDAHDGAIAYLDQQVGLLFDELQKRGLLENTLVIITSDHGEEFHEHGVMAHGWSTYLKALHVPLMIAFPSRVPSGKSVSEPVTLRDLPATVLDLLNLSDQSKLPGSSLVRYWDSSRDSAGVARSPLLSELGLQTRDVPEQYPILRGKGSLDSLIVDRYHYIKSGDGREELYDWQSDPSEKTDLVRSDVAQRTMEEMRKTLERTLARTSSER